MVRDKSSTTNPKKNSVRRTAALEEQLQAFWSLKPEYEEKLTRTLFLALQALIREVTDQRDLLPRESSHPSKPSSNSEPIGLVVINPDSEWE